MMWFVHVLIVKCWTLKERWLPFPCLIKQPRNTHFQSLAQKLGTWARTGCCNNTQQGDAHAEAVRSTISDILAETLTPWCFCLALSSSNPSWLWASIVCITARHRVLWTRCFWNEWPQGIMGISLLHQALFFIPEMLVLSARIWLQPRRTLGFSVSRT